MGRPLRIAIALALALAAAPAAGRNLVAVAVEGKPASNGLFSAFTGPFQPHVGSFGLVGFQADQTVGEGLYVGTGGAFFDVVQSGQVVPAGGNVGDIVNGFGINDLGDMAFRTTLTGTQAGTNEGVYRARLGLLTQIARKGQAAPDGNGILSSFLTGSAPTLDAAGDVGFVASLSGTIGGTTDDLGIFRGNGAGPLATIVRNGQAAPDGNGVFAEPTYTFSMNDTTGEFAFRAILTGTSGGVTDNVGIFRGGGGALTRIMRNGQAAPDGNGIIEQFITSGFVPINAAGEVAAVALLTGTSGGSRDDEAIFRGSGGALTTIVRTGWLAPDGNGVFSQLTRSTPAYTLNEAGIVGFRGAFDGTSGGTSDDTGVFLGDGASVVQLAREGDGAPGGEGVFDEFIWAPAATNDGQGVFEGTITGLAGPDLEGLFIADGQEVAALALEGDFVPGSGGRILDAIIFRPQGPDTDGVNEFGQAAFLGFLDDGSESIMLATPDLHWRVAGDGAWSERDNWTVGLAPAAVHRVYIDPVDTTLVVAGPETSTTVDELEVGSFLPGVGIATLEHDQAVELRVENTLRISLRGVVAVDNPGAALTAGSAENGGRLILNGGNTLFTDMINDGLTEVRGNLFVLGPLQNRATGVINLSPTGSLGTELGILNQGTLDVAGIVTSPVENDAPGLVRFSGDSSVFGPFQNDGNVVVEGVMVDFQGLVTNGAGGTIKNTGGTARFLQGFQNNGAYISDPADNEFTDITLGATGYLVGGTGDRFIVSGDLLSSSEASVLWDTLGAELRFEGGPSHTLHNTGEDRGANLGPGRLDNFAWGTLALAAGESLALEGGGALYVTELLLGGGTDQIASLTSNGTLIYYDVRAEANAYLGGQTWALAGGGSLAPAVPEPGSGLLLGIGLVWLGRRRRRSGGREAPRAG